MAKKFKFLKKDTEENRLEDIKRDYKLIRYMDNPSMEVIKETIKSGGHRALEYIGVDNMTPELYSLLIERFPSSFADLPESAKTPELCLQAVTRQGTNLRHISNKTQDLCVTALRTSYNAFQYIPEEFRNEEVYYLAIKAGSIYLKDVPTNRRSRRMCLSAVKQQSANFEHVPDRYRTNQFYTDVFENNKNIFKYMPNELKTEDVCLRVLREDCKFIEFIPKDLQTDNICLQVLSHPYNREYLRFITTDSPVIQKKIKRMADRDKKMERMFRHGHFHGRGRDRDGFFGFPPFEMFTEPIMEYVSECEDKIDELTDMVESIKKEMDEMKKLIPNKTEVHEG
jgi:hypothetical protein